MMERNLKKKSWSQLRVGLIAVALLLTLGLSNAYAGTMGPGKIDIQYNGKSTYFTNKTADDAFTGAEFKLVHGSARSIIITTFSRNMKTLYQAGLVVKENTGYYKNAYGSGKPHSSGTGVAISYGDYDGGVGLYYTTNGYINYY